MYCEKCGSYVAGEWKFCMKCGASQDSVSPCDTVKTKAAVPVRSDSRAKAAPQPDNGRTRLYFKDRNIYSHSAPRPRADYDDGFTDFYSEDYVYERLKQPITAFVISALGLVDFLLIFLSYSSAKFDLFGRHIEMKEYGPWFLVIGAVLMLAAFVLYSVHRRRYVLDFLAAVGFIVSITAFVIILVLLGVAFYTGLSLDRFIKFG